ncbi:unnamed protein product [Closterium sp. NIES-65]|nr:unnamed protein product [Closterium sp. NIES-65]
MPVLFLHPPSPPPFPSVLAEAAGKTRSQATTGEARGKGARAKAGEARDKAVPTNKRADSSGASGSTPSGKKPARSQQAAVQAAGSKRQGQQQTMGVKQHKSFDGHMAANGTRVAGGKGHVHGTRHVNGTRLKRGAAAGGGGGGGGMHKVGGGAGGWRGGRGGSVIGVVGARMSGEQMVGSAGMANATGRLELKLVKSVPLHAPSLLFLFCTAMALLLLSLAYEPSSLCSCNAFLCCPHSISALLVWPFLLSSHQLLLRLTLPFLLTATGMDVHYSLSLAHLSSPSPPTAASIHAGRAASASALLLLAFPASAWTNTTRPFHRASNATAAAPPAAARFSYGARGVWGNASSLSAAAGGSVAAAVSTILAAPASFHALIATSAFPQGAVRGQMANMTRGGK